MNRYDSLSENGQNNVPTSEQPPELDLKLLRSHLRYVLLGISDTFTMVIS